MKPVNRSELFDVIVSETDLDDVAEPLTNYIIIAIETSPTLDHLKHELQETITELYEIIRLIDVKYPYETGKKLTGEID